MDTGKIPPQDTDIEKAILGALILEPEAIVNVSLVLTPEMFYKEHHRVVYGTILSMSNNDIDIDMFTLMTELQKINKLEQIGGAYALTDFTNNIASAAHIELHALNIKEKFIKRELIRVSALMMNKAYSESFDSEDILTFVNSELEKIYIDAGSESVTVQESVDLVIEDIKKSQGKEDAINGFSTDLDSLRQLVPSYEGNQLIVIAARPAMGKTALALHKSVNASNQGRSVLFFSLEMDHKQLTKRLLTRDEDVYRDTLKSRNITPKEWADLDNAVTKIMNHNIIIDDSTFALTGIINKSKIAKKKYDIGAIVIDYLQLVEGDKSLVREQQVAQISRRLKRLSKELDIPIFLLAQLNRKSEDRGSEGFKPKMSDLRESGAIEQDADIIEFPHRACYYDMDDQRVFIIVGKNRDGETGEAEVRTTKTVSKFLNLDSYEEPKQFRELPKFEPIQQEFKTPGFDQDTPF